MAVWRKGPEPEGLSGGAGGGVFLRLVELWVSIPEAHSTFIRILKMHGL